MGMTVFIFKYLSNFRLILSVLLSISFTLPSFASRTELEDTVRRGVGNVSSVSHHEREEKALHLQLRSISKTDEEAIASLAKHIAGNRNTHVDKEKVAETYRAIKQNPAALLKILVESKVDYDVAEAFLAHCAPSLHKSLVEAQILHTEQNHPALTFVGGLALDLLVLNLPISQAFTGTFSSSVSALAGSAEEWLSAGAQGVATGLILKATKAIKTNFSKVWDKFFKGKSNVSPSKKRSQTAFESLWKRMQTTSMTFDVFKKELAQGHKNAYRFFNEEGYMGTVHSSFWKSRTGKTMKAIGGFAFDMGIAFAIPVVGLHLKKLAVHGFTTVFNRVFENSSPDTIVNQVTSNVASSSTYEKVFKPELQEAVPSLTQAARQMVDEVTETTTNTLKKKVLSSLESEKEALVQTLTKHTTAQQLEENKNWVAQGISGLYHWYFTSTVSPENIVAKTDFSTTLTKAITTAPVGEVGTERVISALGTSSKEALKDELSDAFKTESKKILTSYLGQTGSKLAQAAADLVYKPFVTVTQVLYPAVKNWVSSRFTRSSSVKAMSDSEIEKLQALYSNLKEEKEQTALTHTRQLTELQETHDFNMARLKKQHALEKDTLLQEKEQALRSLEATKQREFDLRVSEMQESHRLALNEERANAKRTSETHRSEMQHAEETYQARVRELQSGFDHQKSILEEQYKEELRVANTTNTDQRLSYESRLQELTEQHERDLTLARQNAEELRTTLTLNLQKAEEAHALKIQEMESSFESQKNELREEYETNLRQALLEARTQFELRLNELTEKARLEVTAEREKAETFKRELEERAMKMHAEREQQIRVIMLQLEEQRDQATRATKSLMAEREENHTLRTRIEMIMKLNAALEHERNEVVDLAGLNFVELNKRVPKYVYERWVKELNELKEENAKLKALLKIE